MVHVAKAYIQQPNVKVSIDKRPQLKGRTVNLLEEVVLSEKIYHDIVRRNSS
jgi:hypothetical protein